MDSSVASRPYGDHSGQQLPRGCATHHDPMQTHGTTRNTEKLRFAKVVERRLGRLEERAEVSVQRSLLHFIDESNYSTTLIDNGATRSHSKDN